MNRSKKFPNSPFSDSEMLLFTLGFSVLALWAETHNQVVAGEITKEEGFDSFNLKVLAQSDKFVAFMNSPEFREHLEDALDHPEEIALRVVKDELVDLVNDPDVPLDESQLDDLINAAIQDAQKLMESA